MKALKYFPHDFNARNDSKLVELRMDMGNKGIGIYWSIIEMLYEEGGRIEISKLKFIAYAINEDLTCVEQVVKQSDLFEYDDDFFWSNSVSARLKNIKKISEVKSKAGKASARAKKQKSAKISENDNDTKVTHVEHMLSTCSTEGATNVQQSEEHMFNNININIKEKENNIITPSNEGVSLASDSVASEAIDYEAFVEFYNSYAGKSNLTRCEKLTEKRRQAIKARIKELGKARVAEAIKKAAESKFLNGHNDRNWHANFDFIINANKIVNILEGKYDNENYGNGHKEDYYSVQERARQTRLDDAAARVKRLLAESDREIRARAQQTDDGVQSVGAAPDMRG